MVVLSLCDLRNSRKIVYFDFKKQLISLLKNKCTSFQNFRTINDYTACIYKECRGKALWKLYLNGLILVRGLFGWCGPKLINDKRRASVSRWSSRFYCCFLLSLFFQSFGSCALKYSKLGLSTRGIN